MAVMRSSREAFVTSSRVSGDLWRREWLVNREVSRVLMPQFVIAQN